VDITAPDASQVGTDLKALTPKGTFVPVSTSDVQDIEMPESSTTTVIEGGYKGTIANRFMLGLDVYYTNIGKAFAELRMGTPSVFYNEDTLRQYLIGNGMGEDEATALAAEIAGCPVGTIAPDQAGASADLLAVNEQTDESYSFWGSDVSLEAAITDRIFADATYSLLQDNVVIKDDAVVQILSVPENKAALGLSYRDGKDILFARAQARYVEGFQVENNVFSGWVDSYTLLDLEASYRLKMSPSTRLFVNATNVFNHVHQEYIGVPEIGRLVVGRIQVDF
jgi:iron complex outermembrane receptor protein